MRKQKEYEQLDLFSFSDYRYQITKPIRLIEFFAGVGFQRMGIEKALDYFLPIFVVFFYTFANM